MARRQKKPNVLWIFGDQHRAQALGYMGDPNARTPHLDRFATEGVTFRNAVSGCPWCAPFRGALFTSLYNHESVQRTPQRLDPALPLVTDVLNENGYMTAYFGKWHLGGHNEVVHIPRKERGRFRVWLGYENNNSQYDCYIHGHDLSGRDDSNPRAEKLEGYETDELTDRLISFLEGHDQKKPFFGVLSVQPPHDPHIAPPEYAAHYKAEQIRLRPNVPQIDRITKRAREDLAGYYAQIENLDANFGRVLEALNRLGLRDNTHVFFFSDHGDMHGSHGYSRKSSPWEESVRIPCIVRPAKGRRPAIFSDAPFNHVDFAPTTLGLCGIDPPEWMQGTDFSHHVSASRPRPESEPHSAYLQHPFRKRFECLNRPWRGVRTRDGWKYVCLEGQPFAMFNLNEDPYETANLAFLDDFNEQRERLQTELAGWIERTGDTFSLPEL